MASAEDYKTVEMLRRMYDASGTGAYLDAGVVCPFCPRKLGDYSYVHLGDITHLPGNDNYESSNPWGLNVRGDVVAQEFWGECGHRWIVAYGEHKGGLLVKFIELPGSELGFAAPEEPE